MDLDDDPIPLTPPPAPVKVGETIEVTTAITPNATHLQTPTATSSRHPTPVDSFTPTPIAPPIFASINQANEASPSDRVIGLATGAIPISKDTPLGDIPELADRYLPITSTDLGVDFRNTHKFCLKPPSWTQWTPDEYQQLGKWLEGIGLIDIARQLDKPVQEVACMIDNVAITPLHDASQASQRGAEGMDRWFERYGKYGIPMREWTMKKIQGELSGVSSGKIHLVLANGNKLQLPHHGLSQEDQKWLRQNLTAPDKKVFFEAPDDDHQDHVPVGNYRPWGSGMIEGTFDGVSFAKVHIVLANGSRVEVPKDQLTADDGAWMREKDEEGEGRVSLMRRRIVGGIRTPEEVLERNALTVNRYWTMERYEGHLCGFSHRKLHLVMQDGRRKEVAVAELNAEDKAWLKANVSMEKRRILSGKAAEEASRSAAAGSDARAA